MQEVFEIVAVSSRDPLKYTKDEQDEIICGKFYQSDLIKVTEQWIRLQQSWSLPLHSYFQTINSALPETFFWGNWIWKVNGRLQFRLYPTQQFTKTLQREGWCFFARNFQSRQNPTIWNLFFILPLRILMKPWTFSFKKDTITAKIVSKLMCLEQLKNLRFTLQMKDLVLPSLAQTWEKSSELMFAMKLVWCWEEKDLTIPNLLPTMSAYTLFHDIKRRDWA